MYDVLVYFDEAIIGPDGARYDARACTRELDDGRWSAWLEFSADGADWRTTKVETIQPNRRAIEYWVTGLSRVYLEGALARALGTWVGESAMTHPGVQGASSHREMAARTPTISPNAPRAILDPFTVYAQGEGVLRAELGAISSEQLRNIAAAFRLESPETASTLDAGELRERIVAAARARASREANSELRR